MNIDHLGLPHSLRQPDGNEQSLGLKIANGLEDPQIAKDFIEAERTFKKSLSEDEYKSYRIILDEIRHLKMGNNMTLMEKIKLGAKLKSVMKKYKSTLTKPQRVLFDNVYNKAGKLIKERNSFNIPSWKLVVAWIFR